MSRQGGNNPLENFRTHQTPHTGGEGGRLSAASCTKPMFVAPSGDRRRASWKATSPEVELKLNANRRGADVMPISVSPDAEAKAQKIPDFSARLERFINDQFDLEQLRSRH